MASQAARMSWWDTLRLQWHVTALAALAGVVAPNRPGLAWLAKRDAGRAAVVFLAEVRERYGARPVWTWFPPRRTLLVFDAASIEAVLASEQNVADPFAKKWPLSRFVPEALVISSGDEWRERRAFNEAALHTGRAHPHAEAFARIAVREADRLAERSTLGWPDFAALGERVSHQVVFGEGRHHADIAQPLARLVRRANFAVRDVQAFQAFYEALERAMAGCAGPALAAAPGVSGATQVTRQVGFWLYVLTDALQLHVARTLALIAAHPEAQERARAEVLGAASLDAQAIDGLHFLEACLREGLRLWTPVPLLLRRAEAPFSVGRIDIEAGDQVLVHAGFYHRDPAVFGAKADKFAPEAGLSATRYSFSRHRQSCAGESLAVFVLKAALAACLARGRYELVGPGIATGRIPLLFDHFRLVLRRHG